MINKIYAKHIYQVFLTRFLIITLIFSTLVFTLNILEEVKFFSDIDDITIAYPIFLTILNLPSIIFEIFPFIILITTQFFFIKFYNNNEILIFKNNGVNNLHIIGHICLLVFFIGIFIIFIFHLISSNLKHSYLEFKNKYTLDNKYLAVINENGLWIKDIFDEKIMIINAEKVENNIVKNIVISTFNLDYQNQKNIIAEEANITDKNWKLKNLFTLDNSGEKQQFDALNFKTNFDYVKINSLFSNLESLSILELFKQNFLFDNEQLYEISLKVKTELDTMYKNCELNYILIVIMILYRELNEDDPLRKQIYSYIRN